MFNNSIDSTSTDSYSHFLREHQLLVVTILLLALLVRTAFMLYSPTAVNSDDTVLRYLPTAINVLEGHGFSLDTSAPYRPSEACVPLYPLFIALVYAVFGRSLAAVMIVQMLLDLVTCLLVGFIAFKLAPPSGKKVAAFSGLFVYGLVCWFTLACTSRVLTETLAIFLSTLTAAFAAAAWEKKQGGWLWFGAGTACGLAILTRPDSVLLFGAVVMFLAARAVWQRSFNFLPIVFFCLATAVTLAPWTIRNYLHFQKFQPLASEWAWAQEVHYKPLGYLLWIETWMTDETYFYVVFNQAFVPETFSFEPEVMPAEIFDSPAERERVFGLMNAYNQTLLFTPELDAEFRQIANERIARAPLRYYLELPVTRVASVWFTGFASRQTVRYALLLRMLSVVPIIFGGVVGFALLIRRSSLAAFLLTVILVRTVFLGYHYAPETRYIVEVYPLMIAACAVAAAAIWHNLRGARIARV